jgi:hypothetical protein
MHKYEPRLKCAMHKVKMKYDASNSSNLSILLTKTILLI